jgi:hypothetical protein
LPLTVDRNPTRWLIRLEGEVSITSAAELKGLLLEALASAQELELDLEHAGAIDVTLLQLVWAAEREAARAGSGFVSRASQAATSYAHELGFDGFPGAASPMDPAVPIVDADQTQG